MERKIFIIGLIELVSQIKNFKARWRNGRGMGFVRQTINKPQEGFEPSICALQVHCFARLSH